MIKLKNEQSSFSLTFSVYCGIFRVVQCLAQKTIVKIQSLQIAQSNNYDVIQLQVAQLVLLKSIDSICLILLKNRQSNSHLYIYLILMEGNSEGQKNQKFQKLRGKIKLELPSFSSCNRRIDSLFLNVSPIKSIDDNLLLSPRPRDDSQITSPISDMDRFYLKNVFQQKYQTLQKLGEGANGIVKRCKNKLTEEIYAVKIGRMEQEHVVALKRLVEMTRKLKHPNILKMKQLYVDEERNKYYHVIEYLPYPSLKYLISHRHQFTNSNFEKIMKQLLQALQYFHLNHIVHRDIKTTNLLYDTSNQHLYIIDLGIITKTFQRGRRRNLWTNTGTLEYKAPETLEGSTYNQSVDIWAAGIVLYELVEGKTPFKAESQMDIIDNITSIKYKFTPELWVELPLAKLLVTRLLKPKTQRLTASAVLKDPWFQLMNFDYKFPKPELVIKKSDLQGQTSTHVNSGGICISGFTQKKDLIQERDIRMGLSLESKQLLRMTSYERKTTTNVQLRISIQEMEKMLGTQAQKDIINNNS